MNSVTPSPAGSPGAELLGQRRREPLRRRARRGRSAPPAAGGRVGSSSTPARRRAAAVQYASCSLQHLALSHSRCQTAKSAYWIGSSGSGEGRPAANAS